MITVNITLPAGVKKRGKIDPDAPISQIKEEIINAFMEGKNPENYSIAHIATQDIAYSDFTIRDGDTFLIIDKKTTRGNVFIPEE
jgi:predicted RecB family nuclease